MTIGDPVEFDPTPELIRNGTLDYAIYMLSMNGLLSDSAGWVNIDNKYQLIQQHPYSSFYVCPIKPAKQPTSEDIWSINDFLSYKNETPSIPLPENNSFKKLGYEYLYGRNLKDKEIHCTDVSSGKTSTTIQKKPKKYQIESYTFFDSQISILNEVWHIKYGPFTGIEFYIPYLETRTISMEKEFSPAKKEIQFYAMALRQSDFLSELLCYYRIFESLAHHNHTKLLNECIEQIEYYKFGRLNLRNDEEEYFVKPQNVYTLMKRRAVSQIRKIKKILEIENIGEYLFKHERCEIAHGKSSSRVSQIGKDYFISYNNMLILKLASRIAIETKIKEECSRTTAST